MEPSIGNRDDEFLYKWHDCLNHFSKTLRNDVIEYSEMTIMKTKEEIKEVSDQLKALVSTPVYTDIQKTLTFTTNDKSRNNELV